MAFKSIIREIGEEIFTTLVDKIRSRKKKSGNINLPKKNVEEVCLCVSCVDRCDNVSTLNCNECILCPKHRLKEQYEERLI